MALSLVAVGQKITASIINAIINQLNLAIGTNVVLTTTSSGVSISTNGLATFTSVTEVILDALFASTHLNHELTIDYQSDSTLATASYVYRTSVPADVTTATYDGSVLAGANGAASSVTGVGSTSHAITAFANKLGKIELKIANAAIATETTAFAINGAHADPAVSNAANGVGIRFFTQRDDTAFAGIKITFSAACSGTIRAVAKI